MYLSHVHLDHTEQTSTFQCVMQVCFKAFNSLHSVEWWHHSTYTHATTPPLCCPDVQLTDHSHDADEGLPSTCHHANVVRLCIPTCKTTTEKIHRYNSRKLTLQWNLLYGWRVDTSKDMLMTSTAPCVPASQRHASRHFLSTMLTSKAAHIFHKRSSKLHYNSLLLQRTW